MKKTNVIIAILSVVICLAITSPISAQVPPPPPSGHGETGNQESRGAPVGGGTILLLGFAGLYGGYKSYKLHLKKKECLLE